MNISNLEGQNIIVFDAEIKIPVNVCSKQWASLNEMGISVACAFDYELMRYRVFLDDNVHELIERLNKPETVIVGFNHISFDNMLLRANGFDLKKDSELKNYDMKVISQEAAGVGINERVSGFKLDDHLKACGLPMKTANGAIAPIWFLRGEMGKLIDYCLADVSQERALFEFMQLHGHVGCAFSQSHKVPKWDEYDYNKTKGIGF